MRSIFLKPVDRPIEGVIKADDEAMLRTEFEEYVLTNDVERKLENFLDMYTRGNGANGTWISGFFGSGKSHLLKILAMLLENRDIDGVSALDLFLPKLDNPLLKADLERAIKIPSKSILFNIDQRADVINKTQTDALVGVFFKVFDEMCGYYGKQGYIAQFERDLDSRGIYDGFKTAYQDISGRKWEDGREHAILEARSIDRAYARITGEEESNINNILRSYREQHHLSIDDLARQVRAYIDKQGPDFRLNFFVDEVGQFIANNVKLMTNLQSVAESFATICEGRAWVIVTAQSEMGTVVGEMTQQTDDFSKIQARFKTRLQLTSIDVSEVIQKRLLSKTDEGVDEMVKLYHQHENNFGTLFGFTGGARNYKHYNDRDEFIQTYPFVSYQFDLFQLAIQSLSSHNAFEGRHSSVGERSMLAVFQEVAKSIAEMEIGRIATFDQMFEGIRSSIKTQVQKSITAAENQLGRGFELRILKVLFLMKYLRDEFKTTIDNVTVLMIERFDEDIPSLKKKVEQALNILEQQTYIRRNGQIYEFLTDEEKDIEQEIKNTSVDQSSVMDELGKLIFDRTLRTRRIRYDANAQDYPYAQKLDDRQIGRDQELTIHVISPFHEHAGDLETLSLQSTGRDELLVVMPVDPRLMQDLITYKQTEKYINQNFTASQQDSIKRILTDKASRNQDRLTDIELNVKSLLGKAELYISANRIEVSAEDAQTRINKGFQQLISKVYPNLRMLQGISYSESKISEILRQYREGLFFAEDTSLTEAEQEMLAFINMNRNNGIRTTVKAVIDKFSRKPYGWYYAAVICVLAKLCARGKVEVRSDGNLLEDDKLEQALRNSQGHSNVILEPQIEFSSAQIRKAKQFCEEYFNKPPLANEAKALGQEISRQFSDFARDLDQAIMQENDFPFVSQLKPARDEIRGLNGKSYTWYLTDLIVDEDRWLDYKTDTIDKILKFINSDQGTIYRDAKLYLVQQSNNFSYLADRSDEDFIRENINDPDCFRKNNMPLVKGKLEVLRHQIDSLLATEKSKSIAVINTTKQEIKSIESIDQLTDDKKDLIDNFFAIREKKIDGESSIPVIREQIRQLTDYELIELKNKIISWLRPPVISPPVEPGIVPVAPRVEPTYVSSKNIQLHFSKRTIEDENDLDMYMDALKEAWRKAINEGKKIQL